MMDFLQAQTAPPSGENSLSPDIEHLVEDILGDIQHLELERSPSLSPMRRDSQANASTIAYYQKQSRHLIQSCTVPTQLNQFVSSPLHIRQNSMSSHISPLPRGYSRGHSRGLSLNSNVSSHSSLSSVNITTPITSMIAARF